MFFSGKDWLAFRVLWSPFSLLLQLLLHAIDTFNATVILVLGQVCSTTDSEKAFDVMMFDKFKGKPSHLNQAIKILSDTLLVGTLSSRQLSVKYCYFSQSPFS